MWSIFKRRKESNEVFESANVIISEESKITGSPLSEFYTLAIITLTELSNTQGEYIANRDNMQRIFKAKNLGFVKSHSVLKHHSNMILLRFMIKMWRDLGPKTMLVDFEHFRNILKKHNMMCVTFGSYLGDIPAENLLEIESAVSILKEYPIGLYSKPISSKEVIYASNSEELLDAIRFPFHQEDAVRFKYGCVGFEYISPGPYENSSLFIAAPKDYVDKPSLRVKNRFEFGFSLPNRERRVIEQISADKILQGIEGSGYVREISQPAITVHSYDIDPFICSICDLGVIIHSMWGAEADDSTIRRYAELRDAIIGNGL